jgi:uncharacterized Zn finger protein (UPF0148 family)
MSLNPAAGGQTCPNCGAPNSALSIFCAECGTSLSASRDEEDQKHTGQTTVSFTPVSEHPDPAMATWESTRDTQATQEFTPQSPDMTVTGHPASSEWEPEDAYATTYMEEPQERRRGFILGLIASILIAVVIGFFVWSSIVSQGFRDSVTGLF